MPISINTSDLGDFFFLNITIMFNIILDIQPHDFFNACLEIWHLQQRFFCNLVVITEGCYLFLKFLLLILVFG